MRARLSKAAFEEIVEHGHGGLRMAAIAARAGVSGGALLHHFPNKDAVTLAALEYALSSASEASGQSLEKIPNLKEAVLTAMYEDFRSFFGGDFFWTALDIAMDAAKNARLESEIRKLVSEFRGETQEAWTEKLCACGVEPEQAALAVRAYTTLVGGGAIRTLWTHDDQVTDQLAQSFREFTLEKILR